MSDALSSTELYGQHVELLPARTVLSIFITADDPGGSSEGGSGTSDSGDVVYKLMGGVLSGAIPKS